MTDRGLLRAALAERWWVLPDRTFRVAVTLLALADERGGELVVSITSEALARRCVSNRTSLRRSLDALIESGFCVVSARSGNSGHTEITLRPVTGGHSLTREMLCESPADLRDRGHLKPPEEIATPDIQTPNSGQNASDPRARDQDLQRSDLPDPDLRSDLRSPTSRDLSTDLSQHPPEEPAHKRRRPRIDADKIPERAWAAADYLRHCVLEKNPAAVVGTRPWEYGHKCTTGATEHIGPGSRTGLRLSWADQFRRFHNQLDKALRNANPQSKPDDAWRAIARAVHWLFNNQPPGARFRVESPDSIATKWDRISEAHKEWEAGAHRRGANGRPDPVARREWVKADEWDKK